MSGHKTGKTLDGEQFRKRVTELLCQELALPARWLYLSFAASGFRGAVIIRAHGLTDALLQCNALRINPGGEVCAWPITDDQLPPEYFRRRLLSRAEVAFIWPDAKSMRELEEEER